VIVGVGIDVVGVDRLAAALDRAPRLAERLFTPAEAKLTMPSLAGRFAAKEALAKALGAPGNLVWRDAEVVEESRTSLVDVPATCDRGRGRPRLLTRGTVALRCRELGVVCLHLSLSHDAGLATAIVVAEG
jgi:holo-[acyl-carrier protein] synthase